MDSKDDAPQCQDRNVNITKSDAALDDTVGQ
jgi:hypothetical protein